MIISGTLEIFLDDRSPEILNPKLEIGNKFKIRMCECSNHLCVVVGWNASLLKSPAKWLRFFLNREIRGIPKSVFRFCVFRLFRGTCNSDLRSSESYPLLNRFICARLSSRSASLRFRSSRLSNSALPLPTANATLTFPFFQ
jgi:hypothetical protein